jgi:hypothetical protein
MSYPDPLENNSKLDRPESNRLIWYVFLSGVALTVLAIVLFVVIVRAGMDSDDSEMGSTPTAVSSVGIETNSSSDTVSPDDIEAEKGVLLAQMETGFEGNPPQAEIQALLDPILSKFSVEADAENYLLAASTLINFRQQSQGEATEMEMLQWLTNFTPPSGMQLVTAIHLAMSDLTTS